MWFLFLFFGLPAVGGLRHEQKRFVTWELQAIGEGQAGKHHAGLTGYRVVAEEATGILSLQQDPLVVSAQMKKEKERRQDFNKNGLVS